MKNMKKPHKRKLGRSTYKNSINNKFTVTTRTGATVDSINSINNKFDRIVSRKPNHTYKNKPTNPVRCKKTNLVSRVTKNTPRTIVDKSKTKNDLVKFFKNHITNCCNKFTTTLWQIFKILATLILTCVLIFYLQYNRNFKITNSSRSSSNPLVNRGNEWGGYLLKMFKTGLTAICTASSIVYYKFKTQLVFIHNTLVPVYRKFKIIKTITRRNLDMLWWQLLAEGIMTWWLIPSLLIVFSIIALLAINLQLTLLPTSLLTSPHNNPSIWSEISNNLANITQYQVFLWFFSVWACRYTGASFVLIAFYLFGIFGSEFETQIIFALLITVGFDVTLLTHYIHLWTLDRDNLAHLETIKQNNKMLSWFHVTTVISVLWAFWISYPTCCSLPVWLVLFLFTVPVLYTFYINCDNDENYY